MKAAYEKAAFARLGARFWDQIMPRTNTDRKRHDRIAAWQR
jgi:hypothetical protein